MSAMPMLSVVVPVFNEQANVEPLIEAVRHALVGTAAWELVLVDDGSSDDTAALVRSAAAADPRIRLVALARNYGQTAALQAGFDHARGAVVVGMDGDLQNDPADIPLLVAKLEEGFDLVAGYRERRQDALITRKIPSMIANRILRAVTGVSIRDNGCSLKAYRRDLLDRMSLYSDLHRFIPALAAAVAGARIVEVPVRHHPRTRGASKYGLSRIWKVLGDLLTIVMIRFFRERPLRLFGAGALVAAAVTVVFAIGSARVLTSGIPFADLPLVLPAVTVLWLALAWYLVGLGLITETILRDARAEHAEPTPLLHHV